MINNKSVMILFILLFIASTATSKIKKHSIAKLNFHEYSEKKTNRDNIIIDSLYLSDKFRNLLNKQVLKTTATDYWKYFYISISKRDNIIGVSVTNAYSPVDVFSLKHISTSVFRGFKIHGITCIRGYRFIVMSTNNSDLLSEKDLQYIYLSKRKKFYNITIDYSPYVVDITQDNVSYWAYLIKNNEFILVKSENVKF